MLSFINSVILGPILPLTLVSAGIFLLIKLSFRPFSKPMKILNALRRSGRGSSFRSMCLALSGTLGVGNIAGVAAAISTGGAGSIFWMWIFAFAAMIIKYSEIVLSMRYKGHGEGGAALYIHHGLNKPFISTIFSLMLLVSSIGIGNTVQSSAAAESLRICFNIPSVITGVVFSIITLIMICGGRKRIENASAVIIPILSLGYVVVSLCIIIANYKFLPLVLTQIVEDAFKSNSILGGAIGFVFSKAVRLGAARGILSNEAGCGTAAYAHNTNCHPAEQGIWGVFEVFIDTIVLCTLTAFVVLLTPTIAHGSNGIGIALDAYGYYGDWLRSFIGISTSFYALASVVCWSYYGVSTISYLGGRKKSRRLYLLLYSMAGVLGSVFSPSLVWKISDFTVSVMAIINTTCVIALWKEIKESTDDYFSL